MVAAVCLLPRGGAAALTLEQGQQTARALLSLPESAVAEPLTAGLAKLQLYAGQWNEVLAGRLGREGIADEEGLRARLEGALEPLGLTRAGIVDLGPSELHALAARKSAAPDRLEELQGLARLQRFLAAAEPLSQAGFGSGDLSGGLQAAFDGERRRAEELLAADNIGEPERRLAFRLLERSGVYLGGETAGRLFNWLDRAPKAELGEHDRGFFRALAPLAAVLSAPRPGGDVQARVVRLKSDQNLLHSTLGALELAAPQLAKGEALTALTQAGGELQGKMNELDVPVAEVIEGHGAGKDIGGLLSDWETRQTNALRSIGDELKRLAGEARRGPAGPDFDRGLLSGLQAAVVAASEARINNYEGRDKQEFWQIYFKLRQACAQALSDSLSALADEFSDPELSSAFRRLALAKTVRLEPGDILSESERNGPWYWEASARAQDVLLSQFAEKLSELSGGR